MLTVRYELPDDGYIEEVICRCDCLDEQHKLVFEKFIDVEDAEYSEITVRIEFNGYVGFFKRIKNCIKYLFGHYSLDWSHYILFTKDNIDQLEEAVQWIKKNTESDK